MCKLLLALMGLLLPLGVQAERASVSGNWKTVTGKLDDGTDEAVYFQLQQDGGTVAGRAIFPWGVLDVKDGTKMPLFHRPHS